ncbi:class I SAM-dependent methyltransferase [Saccharothrix longispora]|uniref:class I SAM-dependent methyltransferase n=1 Tax=Saccharothrix longispora TaxID=33920 RepID=UPI0028FD68E3|nr:class I SAM-dependent methyltransferase [Saccharothrix longispora]MDU0290016.1 class I SAM-dependent methyltransferase [Saccharothrix longispora]
MLDRVLRTLQADRVRRGLRDKLLRAVAEAVAPYHEEQNRRIDALSGEIGALRADVHRQFDRMAEITAGFEHRARRDLVFAAERQAAADSAGFVLEAMPTAPHFPDPHATLTHAVSLVEGPGMALEFGVYTGTTLKMIAAALADNQVYGFDSFVGLPEAWRTGFDAGAFGVEELPDVPGAELVAGWFDETLPGFMAEHPGEVAFLHVDCDLYSSTKTVLDLVGPRLRRGSVVLFDEYFNYQGWRDHEYRAWMEYVERTGTEFSYEGYTFDHEQVIVRVTSVPEPATGR